MGQIQEQHRFVLTSQLAHIAFLEEQVAQCEAAIEHFMAQTAADERPMPPTPDTASGDQGQPPAPTLATPATPALALPLPEAPDPTPATPLSFQQAVQLLDTLPGVNQRIAQIIIAEIGVEMDRFPSAAHLASWVGLCPGNHQSAGKQLRGTTRKGDRWLRQALIEAAQGAMRTKDSYLRAQGERLTRRRGKKRAVVAVAHTIVIMAYHMLHRRQPYEDLGNNYFDERERAAIARQSVRRLEHLGFQVTLQAAGEVA